MLNIEGGAIHRFLKSLSNVQIKRLIDAPYSGWAYDCWKMDGRKCLVCLALEDEFPERGILPEGAVMAAFEYDTLCHLHGKERVVLAIKTLAHCVVCSVEELVKEEVKRGWLGRIFGRITEKV